MRKVFLLIISILLLTGCEYVGDKMQCVEYEEVYVSSIITGVTRKEQLCKKFEIREDSLEKVDNNNE